MTSHILHVDPRSVSTLFFCWKSAKALRLLNNAGAFETLFNKLSEMSSGDVGLPRQLFIPCWGVRR